ncbi:MAG: LptF/LptG family permease [Devosia sp.]
MQGSNRSWRIASIPPSSPCYRQRTNPVSAPGDEARGIFDQQTQPQRQMSQLSRYLLRLFSAEAASLFGVAAFLLFLIQCLRLFDVVSDRGQSLLTLLGQALLGMPALGIVFLYVCVGIGLGRALRALQDRSELQIIHVGALVPSLLRAVGIYGLGGAALLLALSHFVDPMSVRASNDWSTSIAADLVSRSMIPHRFTEVVDGVSMVIGSRDAGGKITDFFADDTRGDGTRRTYFAKSAVITRDEEGFVLRMQDGATQQLNAAGRFSEISFTRYDLALDKLTGSTDPGDGIAGMTSLDIVRNGFATGNWPEAEVRALVRRSVEGIRVIAMTLFVAALAAFPTGKRRRVDAPIELVVLGAAFVERGLASYLPGPAPYNTGSGAILLGAIGLAILLIRLRVFVPMRIRRSA